MYNNLIYLLVVIFVLTTNSIPDTPQFLFVNSLSLFIFKAFLFQFLVRFVYRRNQIQNSARYFAIEQKLSILAIVMVALDVYLLDCQYFFARLPLLARPEMPLPIIITS